MSVQAPERPPVVTPVVEAVVVDHAPAVVRTCLAALLSTAGAAWMAAGLFKGAFPRIVGVAGAVLGASMIALSYRSRRPSLVQYLVAPAAALLGALLVLPDARGGADLTSLVGEALRGGGLAQPPLPFDPGWKFVLVVLTSLLAAAAASVGIALARPKLAVAMPVPVVLGGALLAPPGGETTAAAIAVGFLLAALGVSYGSELEASGDTSAGFERKRLVRGAVLLVMLTVAIVGLGRARFLFPTTTKERIVPAQRPTASQVLPDRVLFEVASRDPGPWRLGVLDGYDGRAWLLPSYEPSRLRDIAGDGSLNLAPQTIRTDRETVETTFTIGALEGHVLPVSAGALSVGNLGARAQLDPQTQSLRLPERRLRAGFRYTVVASARPSGRELSEAPAPPAWAETYLAAPVAPNEVVTLLAKAPRNAWDRLQFVRAALYAKVIAAGAGHPAEVPPERVVQLLNGTEATPYEITAAETLIARWAGVPARIGYGFYAGDRSADAALATVRPRHGATWLEAYFEGYGWVAVVGVPPRARSSLSEAQKNPNQNVQASEELALTVHIPIRLQTVKQLYVTVRYWVQIAVLALAILLLLWWSFPGVLKMVRRAKRARWARVGARERIAVAYAELRDAAADLGIGATAASPLRFCEALMPDEEHTELAWLATRALWGDLQRDARDEDADLAEEMARSVRARLVRAHPVATRLVAFGARTSLRDPYSTEMPNIWPRLLASRTRAVAVSMALAVAVSCGSGSPDPTRVNALPARLVPPTLGTLVFKRERRAERAYALAGDASLVTDGRVFSVRDGTTIQASVQASAFKPEFNALDHDIREGVLNSLGGGRFRLRRLGEERVYVRDLPEQRLLLWFTPDGGALLLMDARRAFSAADDTFESILRYVRGEPPTRSGPPPIIIDPRRGAQL